MKAKDPLERLNGALSAYSARSAKYYTISPLLFPCSIISLYLCNFTITFLTDNLASNSLSARHPQNYICSQAIIRHGIRRDGEVRKAKNSRCG